MDLAEDDSRFCACRILLLPREIRDEILKLTLNPSDVYFTIRSGRYCGLPASLLQPISVQVLRVNKQLHREGKEILQKLYRQRPFVFRISARSTIDFLKSLPQDDRNAIHSVCLPEECYTCDDWGNRDAWDVRASSGRLNMYNIFDGTLLRLATVSFFISRLTMCLGAHHNAVNQAELASAIQKGSLLAVNFVCSVKGMMWNASMNCGMWKLTNGECRPLRFKAITQNIGAVPPPERNYQSSSEIQGLKCLSATELKQILRSKWNSPAQPVDSSAIQIFTIARSENEGAIKPLHGIKQNLFTPDFQETQTTSSLQDTPHRLE